MTLDLGQKFFEVLVCKLGCHLSSPTCAENFHAQHKHVDSMLGAQQTNESKTDFVLEARSPYGFVDAKHPTVASHLGQKPFKHGTTFAETSSNRLWYPNDTDGMLNEQLRTLQDGIPRENVIGGGDSKFVKGGIH